MVARDSLDSLAAAAHTAVSANRLVDIANISVDLLQPPHARIEHFVNEIENPYMFKVNGTTVRVSFATDGPPLSQLLKEVARIKHC